MTRHGNAKNVKVPNVKTSKGRCGICFRGPKHWNGLNNTLKEIEKFETFKREVSKSLNPSFDNHPTSDQT